MFSRRPKLELMRFVCVPLVLALLNSCADRTTDREGGPQGGSVVVGLLSEPKTLNPLVATSIQAHDIINLMFLKLLVEEPDFLNFRPRLAERWSFSGDSLAITFYLRRDVVWEDGEPVTSADVHFTWQLQTDTLVAWTSRNLKDRITDVEVVDDYTVTFHFANRYSYQLADANDGVILPRHVLESIPRETLRTSEFGRNPVGNGPFKLSRWAAGRFIELERSPSYYVDDEPHLDRVVFRIVPDMTNLVTQLEAGEIDCLESIPADALPDIRSKYPEIKIYRYLSRGMSFVVWNLEHELFADRAIRRALAMAINGPEIIETLWGGMAEQSDSPMHPMLWAHDPGMKALPFDPQGARLILKKKGWTDSDGDGVLDRDGRRFEFEMTTNQGIPIRADIVTMVQAYLRQVGVKVNARILEWNVFIDEVVKGEFESCVLGWKVPTRADLTGFWHSTSTPPRGFNASRYRNARADALMERARNAPDQDEARSLWYECQRVIYEDQPIFFLAVPYEIVGLRGDFCNVKPDAHGFLVNLHEWYAGEGCD